MSRRTRANSGQEAQVEVEQARRTVLGHEVLAAVRAPGDLPEEFARLRPAAHDGLASGALVWLVRGPDGRVSILTTNRPSA